MASIHNTLRQGAVPETHPLRLIAAQGGLGVELYAALAVGPLLLRGLSWSLPGVRFPVDLSGGVRSFKNRRGELESLEVAVELDDLARWLEPRTRALLGGVRERPSLWPVDGGLGIGLWCEKGTVAFDVLWAPDGCAARFVVCNARGVGFEGPALAQALAVVDVAFRSVGRRRGRAVTVDDAAEKIVRAVLPELGVRVPSARDVALSAVSLEGDACVVRCGRGLGAELGTSAGSALALAELLQEGDDALLAAEPEAARDAYVAALERAPRHPEICQLVATLDSVFAERSEAALGLLVESLPVTAFGLLGAELLMRMGDTQGAELAVTQESNLEPYAPLAAGCWLRLAELSLTPALRLDPLDRALSISPRNPEARWARLCTRVEVGDINGAVSDAEHLEAAARGAHDRYQALTRAAEHLQRHGLALPAGKLFERALRYRPREARAHVGLAESLIAGGKEARALPLLMRAADDADDATCSRANLVLAKLLASVYRDLPQAIARAQRVSSVNVSDAIEARALEASWRERLGDLSGATLAYSRLHDLIANNREVDAFLVVGYVLGASRFAAEVLGDPHAAHRYAALALRMSPKDARVQSHYRAIAHRLGPEREDAEPATASSGDASD